jgi:diaminohydroxyphosphoribosylaminopyrimidine deaminase / 5-amino-6-(5-phosphoribosylamino)uracil reductase
MYSQADFHWMSQALSQAQKGLFTTTPNPRVGCVLVKNEVVVGQGWHRKTGEPHAEALALAEAGDRARGATAYVTLEPCSHFGKTPPCASALIEAGVSRVFAAMEDPNPLVAGQGLARLRAAGIEVRCGLLGHEALQLNPGFVQRMQTGRPWVRMKIASSLDGFLALPTGTSRWITGAAARADGHAWRARACAILTGVGTVLQDDPVLTVREVATTRQPLRIIVDSRLETPLGAQLLTNQEAPTLIAHLQRDAQKERALSDAGIELMQLDSAATDKPGKLDLGLLLMSLGRRGINELHVEAGAKLNASLLQGGFVDEIVLYQAPLLLGAGLNFAPMLAPTTLSNLSAPFRWKLIDRTMFGEDQRLVLQKT